MDSSESQFNKYQSLFDQYQIFVWDFDFTLLKIHAYGREITQAQVESLSWNKLQNLHFSDAIFFRDLVAYLIKKNKKVAIISFGTYNVIKAYLDRLFGDEEIFGRHNIYTPLEGNKRYGPTLRPSSDKNQYLIELVRANPGVKYSEVIMFDDSPEILEAAEEDLGVKTVLVKKGIGFTKKTLDNLVQKPRSSEKKLKKKSQRNQKKDPEDLVEGFTNLRPRKEPELKSDLVEGFNKFFQVSDRSMNWINLLVVILLGIWLYNYYV